MEDTRFSSRSTSTIESRAEEAGGKNKIKMDARNLVKGIQDLKSHEITIDFKSTEKDQDGFLCFFLTIWNWLQKNQVKIHIGFW